MGMTGQQKRLLAIDVLMAVVIFFVALMPRLAIAEAYDKPPQSEEELYNRYAVPWALGEGTAPREKEFPWHPLGSITHRPPGYVVFLGAIYKVAGIENFGAVRTTQAFMDASSMVLLYILGALVFGGYTGRATGAVAALATARYDFLALFVGRLLSETFFTWLMLLALVLAIAGLRRRSALLTFLGAFVLGWANVTRPFLIFLLAALPAWIAVSPPYPNRTWIDNKRPHLLAATLGILLAFAPVIVRNWQFHERFILLSTNSGYTLYHGLSQVEGLAAPEELGTEEEVKAMELGEVEESAEFRRRAVAYLSAHPGDVKPMLARRVEVLLAAKGGHRISHELMVTPDDEWFYPLVMILGAIGVLMRPFTHLHPRLLVYGAIGSQIVVSLLANAEVRYRVPVVPLLALMGAWAVVGLVDGLITRVRPRI